MGDEKLSKMRSRTHDEAILCLMSRYQTFLRKPNPKNYDDCMEEVANIMNNYDPKDSYALKIKTALENSLIERERDE
ncbi:MAG: hypothetical protein LBM01_03630 [Christensenellaceae bacterium]|jgi:hypothetical protein|nr:hypothetical protein [Christensenellaceae bacterium]